MPGLPGEFVDVAAMVKDRVLTYSSNGSAMKLLDRLACGVALSLAIASGALADDSSAKSNEQLAKEAQNPIADLISIPFQNNFNFGYGPYDKLQYILNIQPVVPFHISDDWNLITRTIVPVISLPQVSPFDKGNWGIGDVNPTFFFSPSHSGEIIWGFGPTLTLPTASQKNLGSNQWSAGPAFVALTIQGPWVLGALINNQWSFASAGSRGKAVNAMTLQPFVNYNFPGGDGWYLTTSPIVTANWNSSGEKWVVPVGGGVGRLFKVGKFPVNIQLSVYDNVITPKNGARWQTRFQIQFLL
jgi:hypothetical protein